MKRIFLAAAAVVLLAGCTHHHPPNQAQAEAGTAQVPEEPTLTGETPAYPRALPVTTAISETNVASQAPTPPADQATAAATNSTPNPEPGRLQPTAPPLLLQTNPSGTATAQEQVVVLDTTLGRMVIELNDAAAPRTCDNFRKLVAAGFYNGTIFHRVIPNFMIQGGDPNTKGQDQSTYGKGSPGYTLPAEISLPHDRGAVAMARLPDSVNPNRDSNGSQFYICVAPCPTLDGQYTVFGQVISGMDVADHISEQDRDAKDDPLNRIEMTATLVPKDRALDAGASVNP